VRNLVNTVFAILLGLAIFLALATLTSCVKLPSEIVVKHCLVDEGVIGEAADPVQCADTDSLGGP
jgi:hypothetical protein